ncbi:MAG: hypothetical protein SVU32_06750 [Candidatus Nanohaloarchaea archaeon]|nr:hypothetical protein [Candidatus Nanohaloarchaea archaeon]
MPSNSNEESLFVRVEGYKVILQDLEAVRQIIENMREAVEVLNQVEQVKEASIETFLENVDRLNGKLESIGGELPRVQDMDDQGTVRVAQQQPSQKQPEPEEAVDESIKELHSELQGLKDDLDQLQ